MIEQMRATYNERVLVADGVLAVGAHVEVLAHGAAEPLAGLDLHAAGVAGAGEGGRVRVVQVVQHHHAAVLRAPHAVELVVVALAQRQERLRTHAPTRTSTHFFVISRTDTDLDLSNNAVELR